MGTTQLELNSQYPCGTTRPAQMAGPCTWLNRAFQTLTAFPLWVNDIHTDMCPVCNAHHLWSTSRGPGAALHDSRLTQLVRNHSSDPGLVSSSHHTCQQTTSALLNTFQVASGRPSLILMLTQTYRQGMRIPRSEM